MNKQPSSTDRDRLIADTYHGDWTSGPASALAAHAARTARGRRTIRRMVATVTVVALLASGARWIAFPQHATEHMAASVRHYEIISDAELMSCLRDQSAMIFPDAEGRTQVVWLIGG